MSLGSSRLFRFLRYNDSESNEHFNDWHRHEGVAGGLEFASQKDLMSGRCFLVKGDKDTRSCSTCGVRFDRAEYSEVLISANLPSVAAIAIVLGERKDNVEILREAGVKEALIQKLQEQVASGANGAIPQDHEGFDYITPGAVARHLRDQVAKGLAELRGVKIPDEKDRLILDEEDILPIVLIAPTGPLELAPTGELEPSFEIIHLVEKPEQV
jgi:hypothetical protein